MNFPNNRSFQKLELVRKATGTQRVSNNPLSSKDISPYSHALKVIKLFQEPNTKWIFCFRKLTTMKEENFWVLTGICILRLIILTNTNRKSFLCLNIHTHTHTYVKDSAVTYSSRTQSLLLATVGSMTPAATNHEPWTNERIQNILTCKTLCLPFKSGLRLRRLFSPGSRRLLSTGSVECSRVVPELVFLDGLQVVTSCQESHKRTVFCNGMVIWQMTNC